ncbi:hypothetical protein BD310DRAFT_951607 [Dichomitus squalens]|uniref:Uncharacterized protein n=1 Tax=Dichomitus squalens TaxID=114155 RepID=A0A4Q9PJB1_9APHY|nr:hypothetical protein BD310DRAFT_951607 [Dichomitus squalens]
MVVSLALWRAYISALTPDVARLSSGDNHPLPAASSINFYGDDRAEDDAGAQPPPPNHDKPEKKPRKKWTMEEMHMLVAACNKTRLPSKVRSALADGTSIFEKTWSTKRPPFTEEEDRALEAGYDKDSTVRVMIVKDPTFQAQNRQSTNGPATPLRAATDDALASSSLTGPVRRKRQHADQGLFRGETKSVPESANVLGRLSGVWSTVMNAATLCHRLLAEFSVPATKRVQAQAHDRQVRAQEWLSANPHLEPSSSRPSSYFSPAPSSPFSFPQLNRGVLDRYDLFPTPCVYDFASDVGISNTRSAFSDSDTFAPSSCWRFMHHPNHIGEILRSATPATAVRRLRSRISFGGGAALGLSRSKTTTLLSDLTTFALPSQTVEEINGLTQEIHVILPVILTAAQSRSFRRDYDLRAIPQSQQIRPKSLVPPMRSLSLIVYVPSHAIKHYFERMAKVHE